MKAVNVVAWLVIYALLIYIVSRVINWCCVKGYTNLAWLLALLPIIGVLATAFQ
jgi:hypothetical protein